MSNPSNSNITTSTNTTTTTTTNTTSSSETNSKDGTLLRTLSQVFKKHGASNDGKEKQLGRWDSLRLRGASSLRLGDTSTSTPAREMPPPVSTTGSLRRRDESKSTIGRAFGALRGGTVPGERGGSTKQRTTTVAASKVAAVPEAPRMTFGVPLDQFMQKQREQSAWAGASSDPKLPVPTFFNKIIEHILIRGIRVEGLLRVAGEKQEALSIIATLNRGDAPDFYACHNVHTLADVLKGYVRELPGNLFDCQHYEEWLKIAELTTPDRKAAACKRLIESLDTSRQALIAVLFQFLREVSRFSKYNKMIDGNIGKVIGPNVLSAPGKYDAVVEMQTIARVTELVEIMLAHYDTIFCDLSKKYRIIQTIDTNRAKMMQERMAKVTHRDVPATPTREAPPPLKEVQVAAPSVLVAPPKEEKRVDRNALRKREKMQSDGMIKKRTLNRTKTALQMDAAPGASKGIKRDASSEIENFHNSPLKRAA